MPKGKSIKSKHNVNKWLYIAPLNGSDSDSDSSSNLNDSSDSSDDNVIVKNPSKFIIKQFKDPIMKKSRRKQKESPKEIEQIENNDQNNDQNNDKYNREYFIKNVLKMDPSEFKN